MPYVLPDTNSAILFVPACGTSWIKTAILRAGINYHEDNPYRSHKAYLPESVGYSCCFVRDPKTWVKSRWAKGPGAKDDLPVNWDPDYETFAASMEGRVDEFFGTYSRLVDFVGFQETLEDDLIEFLNKAGEIFDEDEIRKVPRTNVTNWGRIARGQFQDGTRVEKHTA